MLNADELLKEWISDGWKRRGIRGKIYKERVQREYKLICDKGFADYFLVVSDLVKFAKSQNIFVGPGRGSSVGSLVTYLLGITEIDPMIYPMLFERFLSDDRVDPPDIDVDFDDSRRDEIFRYAAQKYTHVANIATFTKYRGRNSIDDISRVYHIPEWITDVIKSKIIERPEGDPRFTKTLQDTFSTFSDVADLVKQRKELAFAARLEGNVRNLGIHAAGLVLSSRPLDEICAVYEREGRRAIAYDKRDAAYLGLLKIDILGLKTMGVLAEICRIVGMPLETLYRLPLDDEDVFDAFRRGDTLGVFQFEGNTTRRILKAVAPQRFMQLSDVSALSRPGANDREYLTNKKSNREIKYVHPIIENHLNWTNGVIVYEEQILSILRDLGGFEPKELNRMRKVIHDKLGSTQFNEYHEKFIAGCGLPRNEASQIWDTMVGAAGYAFIVPHSVSYSVIGYWTEYFKVKYPLAFYVGNLTRCEDDERRARFIREATLRGITVEPPNLLESQENWTIGSAFAKTGETRIIAGFNAIAGIGPAKCKAIMEWRAKQAGQSKFTRGWANLTWDDLLEIKGFGPKTIAAVRAWVDSDDPFGTQRIVAALGAVRAAVGPMGEVALAPPTHVSTDLVVEANKVFVTFVGIPVKRKYYDAAEQMTKRVPGLSYEQALEKLDDPELLKYCALYCEDEYGEIVVVRVSRWKYGQFANAIENTKLNKDVVWVQGYKSDFMGCSVNTKRLEILET